MGIEKINEIQDFLINKVGDLLMVLFSAFIVFVLGWWLSKILSNILIKMIRKANIDEIVIGFIKTVLDIVFKVLIIIMTVSKLGVDTTSLVAVLTTAGATIVLGLKDSASGVVSGITILFSKPFSKGDVIEVNGYTGKVLEIQLLYTILLTLDNKRVVVPNNELASSTIINYSFEDTRRVDLSIDVHYDSDVEKAKKVIECVVMNHPLSLKEPEPFIRVEQYKDSSIAIGVKVWAKNDDFLSLKSDLLEDIKKNFDKEGIEMAYPQLDLHIKQ